MRLITRLTPLTLLMFLMGCATSLPWPESPLYAPSPTSLSDMSRDEAIQTIVGHYAHFDVVAYEDTRPKQPMRTFIVSYGFTDFYEHEGELYELDRFCHAKQHINFKSVTSEFSDRATQAIIPIPGKVDLSLKEGQWHLYRPATPTLLGVTGNPALSFSENFDQFKISDDDHDGKPGVTVNLTIGGLLKGKIYIARREVFENRLVLVGEGDIRGTVIDRSEQKVLGASLFFLNKPSDPAQLSDPTMNPIRLIKIPESIDTCDALMAQSERWFPPAPHFY